MEPGSAGTEACPAVMVGARRRCLDVATLRHAVSMHELALPPKAVPLHAVRVEDLVIHYGVIRKLYSAEVPLNERLQTAGSRIQKVSKDGTKRRLRR
mmetsp:Transcript_46296/g.100438  ORF Transcript_46296/g.100438 Transcript_46296/m.100438 type:complete len:97 (+) Transcript_46296:100-390(+)